MLFENLKRISLRGSALIAMAGAALFVVYAVLALSDSESDFVPCAVQYDCRMDSKIWHDRFPIYQLTYTGRVEGYLDPGGFSTSKIEIESKSGSGCDGEFDTWWDVTSTRYNAGYHSWIDEGAAYLPGYCDGYAGYYQNGAVEFPFESTSPSFDQDLFFTET